MRVCIGYVNIPTRDSRSISKAGLRGRNCQR